VPALLQRPSTRRDRGRRPRSQLVELVLIVAVALGLAFGIQALLVKPFRIPSKSMEPTLQVGQRVLVDRVSGRFSEPHRGDIVVFKPPAGADSNTCGVSHPPDQACPRPTDGESETVFIKRVVGEPGDRIKVIEGRVSVNGELQDEPHARATVQCGTCELPQEITVPPGHFFMMGDNRGQSQDSRVWGPVPEDSIIGNAFFTYWPPKRIGPL
jgi:signal peptidase I